MDFTEIRLSGKTRREHDLLGEMEIPAEYYFGVQTMRAVENFHISRVRLNFFPELIRALADVKQGAAMANRDLGLLDPAIADAIIRACEELRAGKLEEQFVVDMVQGGAGTSTNMNANEVIANRALELLGHEKGEYQWVAQITNTLVYADPENKEARYLCADALEQLGYQAESGAWRNAYLVAAFELRNGTGLYPKAAQLGVGTTAQGMDAQTMLDYMGIIMDTEKIQNRSFTINLKLTDGDDYLLKIHHGVLLYYKDALSDEADLTISTPRIGILAITSGNQENIDKLITVEKGDKALFQAFCDSMAAFDLYFNIIEP